MTNLEYYRNKISTCVDIGGRFGVIDGYPELCEYEKCSRCIACKNGGKKAYKVCDTEKIISWLLEEYKAPKIDWDNDIDWTKVPVDTDVMVRDKDDQEWEARKFAIYMPKAIGQYETFGTDTDGVYVPTREEADYLTEWNFCKLAHEEDIRKYRKRANGKMD